MRDWMFKDVVVQLWESRPILKKVQDEATEIEVERVDVDEQTGIPKLEIINHGVSY